MKSGAGKPRDDDFLFYKHITYPQLPGIHVTIIPLVIMTISNSDVYFPLN